MNYYTFKQDVEWQIKEFENLWVEPDGLYIDFLCDNAGDMYCSWTGIENPDVVIRAKVCNDRVLLQYENEHDLIGTTKWDSAIDHIIGQYLNIFNIDLEDE